MNSSTENVFFIAFYMRIFCVAFKWCRIQIYVYNLSFSLLHVNVSIMSFYMLYKLNFFLSFDFFIRKKKSRLFDKKKQQTPLYFIRRYSYVCVYILKKCVCFDSLLIKWAIKICIYLIQFTICFLFLFHFSQLLLLLFSLCTWLLYLYPSIQYVC